MGKEEDPLQDAIRHPFQYLIISLSRESPRKAQPKTNTSQEKEKKKVLLRTCTLEMPVGEVGRLERDVRVDNY